MKIPPAVKRAIALIEAHGYTVEVSCNKHIRVKANGLPPLFFSVSPSDHRSDANIISLTKRVIRMAR